MNLSPNEQIKKISLKNLLLEINYIFLSLSIAAAIWHRELVVNIMNNSKGIYSYSMILTTLIWCGTNIHFLLKEKKLSIKLSHFIGSIILYFAIFMLNYQTYNQFSLIKFIVFICFSTLILQINLNKFKKLLFISGILSFIMYIYIFIREYIFNDGAIFLEYVLRLAFRNAGPNAVAASILITLLFISIEENLIYDKIFKFLKISILSFLFINLLLTQSRTFIFIAFINLGVFFCFIKKKYFDILISSIFSICFTSFAPRRVINQNLNLYEDSASKIGLDVNESVTKLIIKRFLTSGADRGSGRLDVLATCYDILPKEIAEKIGNSQTINELEPCSTHTSHSVLVDTVDADGGLLINLFYLFSIYGSYLYLFCTGIYKKNVDVLNLSLYGLIASLFTNSLQEPIQLLLIPIIFKLLENPKINSVK